MIPKCHIVFCGLIPSIGTDQESRDRFFHANQDLKAIAKANPQKISYFKTPKYLTINGEIVKNYYADKYHLSKDGAKQVAHYIVQHLENQIPKVIFQ